MNKSRRKLIGGAAAVAGTWGLPFLSRAQGYPSKPVRIVVPFPPAGPTDAVARQLAQKLTETFNQSFIIDNRPGAGGNIGAEIVAKAPADGYTLLIGTTSHAINPSLYKNMGYDMMRDLLPINLLTKVPLVLAVHPDIPAKTLAEFIALAKRPGSKLTYASSGSGTSTHLAAELFKSMTGTQMTHVPYKGSAPALNDLMGGQVAAMFDLSLSMMPHVKTGRLRALAVTSEKRAKIAPDLPTLVESGIPGYEATAWNGLLAPAGTPKEVIHEINRSVREIFTTPDMVHRLALGGAEPHLGSPEDFQNFLRAEIEKWSRVVKNSDAAIG